MKYQEVLGILVLGICSGCGDTRDKVAADGVAVMKELVTTLESVKDGASAKAAKSKLASLGEKMKAIQKRQEKLPAITKEEQDALGAKHGKEMMELQEKLMQTFLRVGLDPAIQAELKDLDLGGLK